MKNQIEESGRSKFSSFSKIEEDTRSPQFSSMGEPLNPDPEGKRKKQLPNTLTVETQWTVSTRVSLNRYQESMILKYLNCEIIAKEFIGTEQFLYTLFLLERLSKGGRIREIRDCRERHVCLVAYTLLKYFPSFENRGKGNTKNIKKFILSFDKPVSFNLRVLGSILRWDPRRYLKIETVPIEVLFERSGISKRYSSYCKGYGEGGSLSSKMKRTRPSAELDGEDEERPNPFDGFGQSYVSQLILLLTNIGEDLPGISII